MSALVLVPGLISLFLVFLRGRIETAFLYVYLPCLLCLPVGYQLRIPHMPPLSAAEFALLPIGVVGLSRLILGASFALMDMLVLLYAASIALSEILHAEVINDGIFSAVGAFISIFLSYVVGRTLIEPNIRLSTVRMFVILVLVDFLPSLYEWRMGQSLYGIFGQRVLGLETIRQEVQMRNGHGRMGEVLGGSEPGGIAFAVTFCLNAWLVYLRRIQSPLDLGERLTKLEKYHVPELLLLLSVLLTQARGPLMALAAGYVILQIPRFKRIKIVMTLVAVLLVAGYFAAQAHFAAFANLDPTSLTEQQGSALYRFEMNKVYPAIAEAGGWTGYGVGRVPHVGGMVSIDNHYLLVHLAWGRLAYILCLVIVWDNVRVLLVRSWRFEALEDRAFIFTMLAAMAVYWFTLMTVYMGGQLPHIGFLLIGWIQSTLPRAEQPQEMKIFAFRRVFT